MLAQRRNGGRPADLHASATGKTPGAAPRLCTPTRRGACAPVARLRLDDRFPMPECAGSGGTGAHLVFGGQFPRQRRVIPAPRPRAGGWGSMAGGRRCGHYVDRTRTILRTPRHPGASPGGPFAGPAAPPMCRRARGAVAPGRSLPRARSPRRRVAVTRVPPPGRRAPWPRRHRPGSGRRTRRSRERDSTQHF
jgi:hypothetical protein